MIMESFGMHLDAWVSPLVTTVMIAVFFIKSLRELKLEENVKTAH
jgi:hypothetical protein